MKTRATNRNTNVIKISINQKAGGRRNRRRRRIVQKEVRTDPEQSVPQPFSKPSARDNLVGYNLFTALAEKKRDELKKTEDSLNQRSTALNNRETELQTQRLLNQNQATQRETALRAREADVRGRERNIDSIAKELDLKFRTPVSISLSVPSFAGGEMSAPTIPKIERVDKEADMESLVPRTPSKPASRPEPPETLGDATPRSAQKPPKTPAKSGGGGGRGAMTPESTIMNSEEDMRAYLIGNASVLVEIFRKTIKPKQTETDAQAAARYLNGIKGLKKVRELYAAVQMRSS